MSSHVHISDGSADHNNEAVPDSQDNREVSGPSRSNKRKTSIAWEHFDRLDKTHCKCRHCHKSLTYGGGTSHLLKHLKGPCTYTLPGINTVSPRSLFVFDQVRSRDALAKMVMKHGYPFNIAEHEYAEDFYASLNPYFKLPSRNTIRADVVSVYEGDKIKVHHLLNELRSKVSLTTDIWSSGHNGVSYCCLTGHYIDDDWNLHKKILSFKYLPYKHDGHHIFQFMVEEITRWNLKNKLCAVVVDNATANDVMTRKLIDWLSSDSTSHFRRELFHVRCSAHILNLIVQDGLKHISSFLERIRDTVRYLDRSPAALQKFKQEKVFCGLHKAREIAMDVSNRWNSTFHMLETALPMRGVLERLEVVDRSYVDNPDETDWEVAKVVLDALRIFFDATRHFSGRLYPTSNVFFRDMCEIYLKMSKWNQSDCDEDILIMMYRPMKQKFDKYWNECSLVLAVAVVFDPRYKMQLVKYFYTKIYSEVDATRHIDRVYDSLQELFIHYGGILPSASNEMVASSDSARDSFNNDFERWCDSSLPNRGIEKSELDVYLEEKKFPSGSEGFDILIWWKTNSPKYPVLAKIARDILAVPATTVASEAAFSVGGRTLSAQRSCMLPDVLEALIVGGDWLPSRKNKGSHDDIESSCDVGSFG